VVGAQSTGDVSGWNLEVVEFLQPGFILPKDFNQKQHECI
jgi:hypothetical protein